MPNDLEVETTHGQSSSFRTKPHECRRQRRRVMLIHVLGRERPPALSCGLPSNVKPAQNSIFFPLGGRSRGFVPIFYTPAAKCIQQKPGRRPPHIVGRSVSTVRQGRVTAPNELATFRFYGAVVEFVKQSMLSIQNLDGCS